MKDHLAKEISRRHPTPLAVGATTSVSPVEIEVQGVTGLPADYMDSYSPTVDDIILVYQDEETGFVILGKIISGG